MRASRAGEAPANPVARWQIVLPWLALIAIVLLTRPYQGIYHDANLYAAQVLRYLGDASLNADVYFAYGNQDDFTVFTPIYARLVQAIGLIKANMVVQCLGLGFWVFALIALTRVFFSDRRAQLLGILGVLALSPAYGDGSLTYAEGFVTPRIFAEAFGLLGIAALLRGRVVLCLMMTGAALALHPLMGLVVVAFLIWIALRDIRLYLLVAILGVGAMAVLGALGLSPFSWLWERMDTAWMSLVKLHAPLVFATGWDIQGYATIPLKLLIILVVISSDSGLRKRVAKDILIVCALVLTLSIVAADIMGNRLFVAMQLWRVLFIMALFANMMAFRVLSLLPQGQSRTFLALALAMNLFEMALDIRSVFSACLAFAAALSFLLSRKDVPFARVLTSIAGVVAIGFVLIGAITLLASHILDPELLPGLGPSFFYLLAVAAVFGLSGSALPSRLAGIIAIAALAGALWAVDRRTDWQTYVETSDGSADDIAEMMKGKTVYWENGQPLLWFKFRMPQYYSCRQKAGAVFFREQAFEIIRRANNLSRLNTSDFSDDPASDCPGKAQPFADGPVRTSQLTESCIAAPELDFIVLETRVPGAYRQVWTAPVTEKHHLGDGSHRKARIPFYIYSCADHRS